MDARFAKEDAEIASLNSDWDLLELELDSLFAELSDAQLPSVSVPSTQNSSEREMVTVTMAGVADQNDIASALDDGMSFQKLSSRCLFDHVYY